MSICAGKPVRVTVEMADGMVLSGEAAVMSATLFNNMHDEYDFGGSFVQVHERSHWEMTLSGFGEFLAHEEFIRETRAAAEWLCVFCKTPNPREERRCDGCGAPRPVAYG